MPDQKLSDMTPGTLTGGDLLYFLRGTTQDFSVTGTGLKAFSDQNAAEVPFTPVGEISATDVQAALAELDTDKISDITGELLGSLSDVVLGTPALDEVLTFNGSIWENAAPGGGGGGEANTGANVGVGAGEPFRDKVGATLNFKTVLSNQEAMNVANNTNEIELSVDLAGAGDGLMSSSDKGKLDGIDTGAQLNEFSFKTIAIAGQNDVVADIDDDTLTLVAGLGIALTTVDDTITISAGATVTSIDDLSDVDTTTDAPVGGDVLEWNGTDNWVPAAPTTGGEVNDGNSLGAGVPVFVGKVALNLEFRSLVSGTTALVIGTGTPGEAEFVIADATAIVSGLITGLEKDKLATIEPAATADQTDAEIKTAYENNADTNAFTNADVVEVAIPKPRIHEADDELAGRMQFAVVATLPGTPDVNTVYFVTT
jgi:hypothetical protein